MYNIVLDLFFKYPIELPAFSSQPVFFLLPDCRSYFTALRGTGVWLHGQDTGGFIIHLFLRDSKFCKLRQSAQVDFAVTLGLFCNWSFAGVLFKESSNKLSTSVH